LGWRASWIETGYIETTMIGLAVFCLSTTFSPTHQKQVEGLKPGGPPNLPTATSVPLRAWWRPFGRYYDTVRAAGHGAVEFARATSLIGNVCGYGRGILETINRVRAVESSTLSPPEL